MAEQLKDRIFNSLVKSKNLSAEDIDAAVALHEKKNITMDKALIERGLVTEQELMILLVRELHIPTIDLGRFKIDPVLKDVVPQKFARKYHLIPISQFGNTVTVAIANPLDIFAVDDLRMITGKEIDVVISADTAIMEAIENFYGSEGSQTVAEIRGDIDMDDLEIITDDQQSEDGDVDVEEGKQAPIIRMVNLIINEALRQKASDIHIEPGSDELRVRYRVDGVLHEALKVPKKNQNAVIVRIKILSRIDITTKRIPQDGRFKLKFKGQEIDFRVSLLPTNYGQKIVMRILDRQSLSVGLDGLGFSKKSLGIISKDIKKPFGMILVTGPTGSGKSTTLYSIINQLNTFDRNIITIEDPVEYLIEGLTQIQARPEIGLTFAEGLKSVLRQSPDIVMVGEIRDHETADIAIKASLTGQLVLSTLHTNDASGSLTRLVDMGVESFLVASSLVAVYAQRLGRKICPKCKEVYDIPAHVLKENGIELKAGTKLYHGKGCDACRGTGYKGRFGLTEILELDDSIRELLLSGASSDKIKEYAVANNGMVTLWQDAIDKMVAGKTTLEEVIRVTARDE